MPLLVAANCRHALCVAMLAATPGPVLHASAASTELELKPAPGAQPKGLTVGRYGADSTLKAPVETLTPEQSWPVTKLDVSLNAHTGLCGDHTIEEVLELPDQDPAKPSPDGPECVFGMLLGIETAAKRYDVAVECGDWLAHAARCWGYGATGEFQLVREPAAKPSRFRLIFPGPAASKPGVKSGAPARRDGEGDVALNDPAAQRHGIFLDTVLDEKGEPKGDVWLAWVGQTVEIAFVR